MISKRRSGRAHLGLSIRGGGAAQRNFPILAPAEQFRQGYERLEDSPVVYSDLESATYHRSYLPLGLIGIVANGVSRWSIRGDCFASHPRHMRFWRSNSDVLIHSC
jgi:hypothetical protein